jgi:hypothetical protein
MDPNITKALNDKLYDKRKSGALELEALIREALKAQDHDRVAKIVHELCHHYAYAVHQPHARNGGLIGLAAASIALGPVWTCLHPLRHPAHIGTGSSTLPRGDCPTRSCLFFRLRCSREVLCMRKHVQHCKSRQGRDPHILQPSLRCAMQGELYASST